MEKIMDDTARKLLKKPIMEYITILYRKFLCITILNKYFIYLHMLLYLQSPKVLLSIVLFLDVF